MNRTAFMNSGYFWFGVFLLIFLFTQDYLFTSVEGASPLLLGLPMWLYYFVGVHLLLVLAILFMTKWYWKNE